MKKFQPTNRWRMLEDNPDAKEAKQFWSEIQEQKEHNRKAEWINKMKKNYKDSKKNLRRTYTWNYSERHSRQYRIRKCQAKKEYMDSGF